MGLKGLLILHRNFRYSIYTVWFVEQTHNSSTTLKVQIFRNNMRNSWKKCIAKRNNLRKSLFIKGWIKPTFYGQIHVILLFLLAVCQADWKRNKNYLDTIYIKFFDNFLFCRQIVVQEKCRALISIWCCHQNIFFSETNRFFRMKGQCESKIKCYLIVLSYQMCFHFMRAILFQVEFQCEFFTANMSREWIQPKGCYTW